MPRESTSQPSEAAERSSFGYLLCAFDQVIDEFAGDDHTEQVSRARKEYEERRGRVFEDEELWEPWTQAFLEWYAVEHSVPSSAGRSAVPAARYLAQHSAASPGPSTEPPGRLARAIHAWVTSHRSLFEVRALSPDRVELVDLFGGGRFSVAERRGVVGVSVGDVAELRLLGFEDEVVFGRTFCFHPSGTRPAIARHIARIRRRGGTRGDAVDYCASLRIRCERYQHVAPVRIYESPPREGGAEE